jgi:hypothetical protein
MRPSILFYGFITLVIFLLPELVIFSTVSNTILIFVCLNNTPPFVELQDYRDTQLYSFWHLIFLLQLFAANLLAACVFRAKEGVIFKPMHYVV